MTLAPWCPCCECRGRKCLVPHPGHSHPIGPVTLEDLLPKPADTPPAEHQRGWQETDWKAYVKEIAAAIDIPPESVDIATCRVVADYARAMRNGLIETQKQLEAARAELATLSAAPASVRGEREEKELDTRVGGE